MKTRPARLLRSTLLALGLSSCGGAPTAEPDRTPPAPTCSDGVHNGAEADVDCGGTCAARCATGLRCGEDGDCASALCRGALCVEPSCVDGVKDRDESDVDCGGAGCGGCALDRACDRDGDCQSGACDSRRCVAAPRLTALSPACGPLEGGTDVTLIGEGLVRRPGLSVTFGGALGLNVTDGRPAVIMARTPSRASAGKVNVELLGLPGGALTLADGFRYIEVAPAAIRYAAEVAIGGFSPSGAIAIGDYNGDGKLDYLQDHSGTHLDLLTNTGGTSYALTVISGVIARRIISGDVDGDGKADAIFTAGDSANLSVLPGAATGLGARRDYATAAAPDGLVAADLNGDGKLDVAVIHAGLNAVGVFLNNGDGTFKPRVDYLAGAGTRIVAADLDGDGHLDLASAAAAGVTLLSGRGDGTFDPGRIYRLPDAGNGIAVADFDGNGVTDLLVASSNRLTTLLRSKDPSRNQAVTTDVADLDRGAPVLQTGDLDGDGTIDVLLLNAAQARAEVWLNGCQGQFVAANKSYAVAGPADLLLRDLTGDGKPDIVTSGTSGPRLLTRQ